MIGTVRIHPSESANIQRACRIKHISLGLGIILFILSMAFPAYIVKTIVTKEPTYTVIKQKVANSYTQSIRVAQPSYEQYSYLYSKYSETLRCPCSQPSINYGSFLRPKYQFHPICSSIFVTQQWIDAVSRSSETLLPNDFRKTASYLFQALRALCQLSQQTLEHNLMQFLSNEYVSINLIPPQMFDQLVMARLHEFQSSTTTGFLSSFSMIRYMIQTNALFSGLQSNYKLYTQGGNISIFPAEYDGGCNCAHTIQCTTQALIYDTSSGVPVFPIPGFYTGCYVIDSLLASDLRCFYNLTCMNLLNRYIPSLSSFSASALGSLLPTVYEQNTTIESILNNLMIDNWSRTLSYIRYYGQCLPSYCTYSAKTTETETIDLIENKTDVASTIGLVIGIIGGIIAILHLMIPILVKRIIGEN